MAAHPHPIYNQNVTLCSSTTRSRRWLLLRRSSMMRFFLLSPATSYIVHPLFIHSSPPCFAVITQEPAVTLFILPRRLRLRRRCCRLVLMTGFNVLHKRTRIILPWSTCITRRTDSKHTEPQGSTRDHSGSSCPAAPLLVPLRQCLDGGSR